MRQYLSKGALCLVAIALLAGSTAYSELRAVKASSEERGLKKTPTRAEREIRAGDFYLLSIGINNYLSWPKLNTAVNDASAVEKVLKDLYAFNRIVRLYNADATRQKIISTLRKLAETLEEDDSLVIFYAGHGHLDQLTGTGSWIPVEAEKDDTSMWISNTDIKSIIGSFKARHILLVSDSCFSGGFFRGMRGAPPAITDEYVRKAFRKTSRQAITSGGLEPVTDSGFDGHSVFSYFFLKQLKDHESPYMLPSELFEGLKGGVAANANQQPALGILQDTRAEYDGEFVFFRKGLEGALNDMLEDKRKQIELLEQMSEEERKAEVARKKELTEKEKELAVLDLKIKEMNKRLAKKSNQGSLDALLALVEQKEKQALELEKLRQEAAEKRKQRETELARLKAEEAAAKKKSFEVDYVKYVRITDSKMCTDDIRQRAWEAICAKWKLDASRKGEKIIWDIAESKPAFERKIREVIIPESVQAKAIARLKKLKPARALPSSSYFQLHIEPRRASALANVYVDNRLVNTSQNIIIDSDVYHRVRVVATGYEEYSENWKVAAGQTGSVNIKLKEKKKKGSSKDSDIPFW